MRAPIRASVWAMAVLLSKLSAQISTPIRPKGALHDSQAVADGIDVRHITTADIDFSVLQSISPAGDEKRRVIDPVSVFSSVRPETLR